MSEFKARVKNGRLVLDEATDLPDGTEVDLVPADWWDNLAAEDRRRLEEALLRSEQEVRKGILVSSEDVLQRLRSKE